jgi:Collagen triple helix repeat (20 copies)
MFQRIRQHLTPSTVIAFLALLFALTGGAFAASSHGHGSDSAATASSTHASAAKSKAKRGPRGPAGPKGATGAPGAAGPKGEAGPQGPAGAAGAKGEAGSQGAAGVTGPKGEAGPQGEEGPQGENGKEGKEGSPWTASGTLPPGKTETGAWTAGKSSAAALQYVPISFTLPLEKPLDESHVHILNESGQEFLDGNEVHSEDCEGSASAPTAKPGNLCIYTGEDELIKYDDNLITKLQGVISVGASTAGASFTVEFSGANGYGIGSWAVTAP